MNEILHIMRKDLRRLRWDIAAWCAVVASRVLLETKGADLALRGFGPQLAVGQLVMITAIIEVVLETLIVSRVVHDEPLVGRDAFWLTRPISRMRLFSEKLIVVGTLFVLLPIAANVVVAAAFGSHAPDLLPVMVVTLLNRALWLSLLMTVAVFTPSLMRYVVVIVGIIGAFAAAVAVTLAVQMMSYDFLEAETGASALPDPRREVAAEATLIAVLLMVIGYLYRTRRLARAVALVVAGFTGVYLLTNWWPWSLPPPLNAVAALAASETPAITATHVAADPPRVSDAFAFGARPAQRAVAVHIIVAGLPPDVEVQTIGARSQLDLPGATLMTEERRAYAYLSFGNGRVSRAVEGALGARLVGSRATDDDQWPAVARVSEEEFAKYGRETGRLSATLDLVLARKVLVGTLPLSDGATIEFESSRLRIARAVRRPTGATIFVRQSRVEPLMSWPRYRQFTYVLWNRTRNEAVAGDMADLTQSGMNLGPLGSVHSAPTAKGFHLDQYQLQFPAQAGIDRSAISLDPEWLADAELAILETVSAGIVTRPLEISAFRMQP